MNRRALIAPGLGALALQAKGSPRSIAIGVMAGPHAEIMGEVRGVAARNGLDLRLVERSTGRAINDDVVGGRLDAACFQDGVSFADEMRRRRGALVPLMSTVTLPFAIYSRRLGSTQRLSPGATIALPREASQQARALVLLHDHGLVELRVDSGYGAGLKDVVRNRFGFILSPMSSGRLAASLDRVDLAAIGMEDAERAGLQPARDGLGIEDARSPWAGVMAVRAEDRAAPWAAALVASYRSEPVKRFILEHFQDSVRRPW